MAELYHIGVGSPFFGETWCCSECGTELEIPEDRDLPETCPDCGCSYD